MRVVHVSRRDERVQGRVDGRRARIEVERAMVVHCDHVILGGRLEAFIPARGVSFLEVEQFPLAKRGEVFLRGRAEIAAGAFNPEHLDRFAGERVFLDQFGGGVAAAGVGDALVGAELVGPVDQPVHAG